MSEKHIHASQQGGESSIKGFRYQRVHSSPLCQNDLQKGKDQQNYL
jgi:hypothetical protein